MNKTKGCLIANFATVPFITTDYLQQCLFENRNALIPVPRRLPWRACHKPTFSRRRKPHAPPFD
ncbi:hypothetical protein AB8T13_27560, partial [Klebsiella pneumoniae]